MTVVGTLLAVALALLVTLPALARDSATTTENRTKQVQITISVHAGGATVTTGSDAEDTLVLNPGGGSTVWVAARDDAYNQVFVNYEPGSVGAPSGTLDWSDDGDGISVVNVSANGRLQRVVPKHEAGTAAGAGTTETALWRNSNNEEKTWAQWVDEVDGPDDDLTATTDNTATELNLTRAFTVEPMASLVPTDGTATTGAFHVVGSTTFAPTSADRMAVDLVATGTTAPPLLTERPVLIAGDNDEIKITANARYIDGTTTNRVSVSHSAVLKVDAVPPSIGSIVPASGTIQRFDSATFGASITDAGSGLRTDAESEDDLTGTGTDTATDRDGDGITRNEPLADADGTSLDIALNVELTETGEGDFATATNALSEANDAWRVIGSGFSVRFVLNNLTGGASEKVYYAFRARDRVNNVRVAGATGGTTKNLVLTVDNLPPGLRRAEAGIGYDASDPTASPGNLKSIKVEFSGGIDSEAETLDASTIEISDFRVESSPGVPLTVAEIIHPNITIDNVTTNDVLYLILTEDLEPGAKPTISIVGTISDVAGNRLGSGSSSATIPAIDKTKPNFGVAVSGTVEARTASKGNVTIRVTVNEPLQRTPEIRLVTFKFHAGTPADDSTNTPAVPGDGIVVKAPHSVPQLAAVRGLENTWEVTVSQLEQDLYGVWVMGVDPDGNDGETPGITLTGAVPAVNDKVDLSKVTLFEIDKTLPALTDGSFTLTPNGSGGSKTTQSGNPFIRIRFAEATEYGIDDMDDETSNDSHQEVEIDTHDSVTLTKLALKPAGGEETDLLGTEGRVDSQSFLVSLSDLAVGRYSLLVNGTDDLGNTLSNDYSYNFEVVKRAPYPVGLWPGNNLVSVPGEPENPSIDVVLPGSHPATAVLAYDPSDPVGPWLAATRDAGGSWSGPLTEIRAGRGYWIDTTTFTPLSVSLQERGSGEVPPTFPLIAGWNLIGVVAPSSDSIGPVTAANYLASVNWAVAYTYSTEHSSWTKITKGDANVPMLKPGPGCLGLAGERGRASAIEHTHSQHK